MKRQRFLTWCKKDLNDERKINYTCYYDGEMLKFTSDDEMPYYMLTWLRECAKIDKVELINKDWLDEGICKRTQDYYGIRYYKYREQVIIPVYDMLGQCVGIRVRNFNPEALAKYDVFRTLDGAEYKLNTSLIMYGIYQNAFNIKRKKKVIICESEKSVLMMDTIYGNEWYVKLSE